MQAQPDGKLPPRPDVGPGATRVLLAIIGEEWPTVSTLVESTGFSRGGVHYHLKVLREAGLVDWVVGRRGTLRALCGPVKFGPVEP